jgi:hypothetical protein
MAFDIAVLGVIDVLATAWNDNLAGAAVRLRPAPLSHLPVAACRVCDTGNPAM